MNDNNPNNTFYLQFEKNHFNKKDILTIGGKYKCKVLETPHKKWYKQLLQFLTFGWYKAPWRYKVKLIK